jgi:hypothetical protein
MNRRCLIKYTSLGTIAFLSGCVQLEQWRDWRGAPPLNERTNVLQIGNYDGKSHSLSVKFTGQNGETIFKRTFDLVSGEEVSLTDFVPPGEYQVIAETEEGEQSEESVRTNCKVTEFQVWIVSGGEIQISQIYCD